ncbi:threonine--tRNA ligase [Candidatus Parcubacteria bacterium]|nr:threonine--tRNA ligase [Candidatus Parcubacteria bacterium]
MSQQKNQQLEILRHSLSHIMMQALERLYNAIPAVGPAIENGFYHDFDCERQITESDLPKIEEEMKKIIKENLEIEKQEMEIGKGVEFLKNKNYRYTAEMAEDLKAEGEIKISFYKQGEFINMCKGPHLASTGKINSNSFKLTKLAGAYWKGDEKNKMIQRIYGVAFNDRKELKKYLKMIEEAEKRDHRKLGKELDLFHIDEKVGLGLPLWHPKGAMLWRLVEDFWHQEHLRNGYELVKSPHIGNRILWETSGHWGFFNESMYPPIEIGQTLKEKQKKQKVKESEEYLLKPMNCPFHIQIYKNSPRSYKELPMRWAECGTVYRFEKKGELSGLTRVRGFTQDDAHIICSADQVENELGRVIDFILYIFKSFGFDIGLINVYLSLRDSNKKGKYAGDDKGWEFTEKMLRKAAQNKRLNFIEEKGEAAFYGPKLDFKLKDCLGREWQCSTLQFDFNLPERFDMTFVNNKGEDERPFVLHRALFGSFERFIALLIEHYAGAFPVWLSPVQVKIISVSESHIEYCKKLAQEFKEKNIRTEVDEANETVGNKIRKAVQEKPPYILVIGDKEMNSDRLNVRDRGQRESREISKQDFITEVLGKINQKR